MDERQQQIQTGAGLTESRLNVEFIDGLKKFGPWVIILVAAAVLAYAGIGRLRASRERAQTEALASYNDAAIAGNPAGLIRVADDQTAYPNVSVMARLTAGDVLLVNIARGTKAGAQPAQDQSGQAGDYAPEDLLKPEDRATLLTEARTQYQQALAISEPKPEWWIHTSSALFGLAAVAENEGKLDEAKQYLERAAAIAKAQDLPKMAEVAQKRIDTLSEMSSAPVLPARAAVQSAPKPVQRPQQLDQAAIQEMIRKQMEAEAEAARSDVPMGPFKFPPTPLILDEPAPTPTPPSTPAAATPAAPATPSTTPAPSPASGTP